MCNYHPILKFVEFFKKTKSQIKKVKFSTENLLKKELDIISQNYHIQTDSMHKI
jgi:hypothetical protein